MNTRLFKLCSLVLGTILVATLTPFGAASAETTAEADHVVVRGAVDPGLEDPTPRMQFTPGRTDRFEYMAYYPEVLKVHRGDTVFFRMDGFQTVTFSPPDEERRSAFRRDEYGEFDENGDPIGGDVALESFLASDPTCGISADLEPCVLESRDQFINSGWNHFWLTIDVPPGEYPYYSMEAIGVEGKIVVVPDDEPVPTPEQVEEQRQAKVLEDTANGEALMEANETPEFEVVGDHVKWFVKSGDFTEDGRVAITRFMPSNLEIAPGDEVEFIVPGEAEPAPFASEGVSVPHTVTFPDDPVVSQGAGFFQYVNPACDPDDPQSGLTGIPGSGWPAIGVAAAKDQLLGPYDCGPGLAFELLLLPQTWENPDGPVWWTGPTRAPGHEVSTPATRHDSGLIVRDGDVCRSSCDPWTDERWPQSFDAEFPNEGTFGYRCMVHATYDMAGSITVTE